MLDDKVLTIGAIILSKYIQSNTFNTNVFTSLFMLPMIREGISRCAIVFFDSESVIIGFVCHVKCIVLGECDAPLKVLQVNSQHDVISIRQTVKIVVSEPELAA